MKADIASHEGRILLLSDYNFADQDRRRIVEAVTPEAALFVRGAEALRASLIAHPEVTVVCAMRPPADIYTLAPHLRWLALPSAGAEHLLREGLVRPEGPTVTTANGVHAVPIAEFVLGAMLMWNRHWPQIIEYQRTLTWPTRTERRALHGTELYGATLGVVGLGAIGRQVARLGRALGMRVVATRRSASSGERDPDVDALIPINQLDTLLGEADFVVLAIPSTPETHQLVNAATLAQMRPSAFLVNIARGDVVDEAALVQALRGGTIAGAALDVFEVEPLPESSPLWTLPNVILSPHVSSLTDRYSERLTTLLLDNLDRYRRHTPLRNIVVPARGY